MLMSSPTWRALFPKKLWCAKISNRGNLIWK